MKESGEKNKEQNVPSKPAQVVLAKPLSVSAPKKSAGKKDSADQTKTKKGNELQN